MWVNNRKQNKTLQNECQPLCKNGLCVLVHRANNVVRITNVVKTNFVNIGPSLGQL